MCVCVCVFVYSGLQLLSYVQLEPQHFTLRGASNTLIIINVMLTNARYRNVCPVFDFRFCLCAGYPQTESTPFSRTLPMIRYVIFSFFANHFSSCWRAVWGTWRLELFTSSGCMASGVVHRIHLFTTSFHFRFQETMQSTKYDLKQRKHWKVDPWFQTFL